jgi:hypothetical protein
MRMALKILAPLRKEPKVEKKKRRKKTVSVRMMRKGMKWSHIRRDGDGAWAFLLKKIVDLLDEFLIICKFSIREHSF